MRVLVVHNSYLQRGGEDSVVEDEFELLTARKVSVELYKKSNEEIKEKNKINVALDTFWNQSICRDIIGRISKYRPDVIHIHNTFPIISPAVFWATYNSSVPTVCTIHNFRLHCPQAMYLRNGRICEKCLGRIPWSALMHRCYRNSFHQTAVLTGAVAFHRVLGTFDKKISKYIALTEFCKQKLSEGGLPSDKIVVKPNFVIESHADDIKERKGGLFVGRLSPEKGIDVLIKSHKIKEGDLKVVGDGPLRASVEICFKDNYLGYKDVSEVILIMKRSLYLVFPSVWYECFPKTIVEAFSVGLPVICSDIGSLRNIIKDGVTGILFRPGDSADLAEKIRWAEEHPKEIAEMGRNARNEYLMKYSPESNFKMLMNIYSDVIEKKIS